MKKLILLLLTTPLWLAAQTQGSGNNDEPALGRKYSNEFLNIGVDARAMAMSNSVIASTGDATSGYWNPAGLAKVRDNWQAAAMHAEYFASIAQYDYLAYAQPLDAQSSIGITLIRFGVDNILNTTNLIDAGGNVDYDRISRFSAADYALIGSYARQATSIPNLSYGGNVKIIYRQIGKFASAIGFGFDAGVQYHAGPWQLGATLRDVTSTFNAWSINEEELGPGFEATGNELPDENIELTLPRLMVGAGRRFELGENYSLHTEVNADFTFDGRRNTLVSADFGNVDPGIGLELGYRNFVFLRGGLGNVQRLTEFNGSTNYAMQPNLGIGFKYRGIAIDYALTDIGNSSAALYSNIFSLRFDMAAFKAS